MLVVVKKLRKELYLFFSLKELMYWRSFGIFFFHPREFNIENAKKLSFFLLGITSISSSGEHTQK